MPLLETFFPCLKRKSENVISKVKQNSFQLHNQDMFVRNAISILFA